MGIGESKEVVGSLMVEHVADNDVDKGSNPFPLKKALYISRKKVGVVGFKAEEKNKKAKRRFPSLLHHQRPKKKSGSEGEWKPSEAKKDAG